MVKEKEEKVEGIKKEYVPYLTALKLKELKYDLPCLFMYNKQGVFGKNLSPEQELVGRNYNETEEFCSAPSYQAVFSFFCKYGMTLGVRNRTVYPMDLPCQAYEFIIGIKVDNDFYGYDYTDISSCHVHGSQGGDFYMEWYKAANAGILKFIQIINGELPTPWYYSWGCKHKQQDLILHKDLMSKK